MNDDLLCDDVDIRINMDVILDIIDEKYNITSVFSVSGDQKLVNVRLYNSQIKLYPEFLYIVDEELFDSKHLKDKNLSFVIIGEKKYTEMKVCASLIVLPKMYNYIYIFELVQQYFEKIYKWTSSLHIALNNDAGVSNLCELSVEFFENPLFVHDDQFFIISCPRWIPGMIEWDIEARTGREIIPVSTINDFKIDKEYINTLQTNGAQIFSASLRGYRILYVNIRHDTRYEGRLCICELQTSFRSIHFIAAQYLVKMIKIAIRKRSLYRESFSNTFESFFTDVLTQKIHDTKQIIEKINIINWKVDDLYFCLKMGIENRDVDILSTEATINYIETNILGSYAIFFEYDIVIIVNLSIGKYSRSDVLSKLSYLLREGLFKAGYSTVFNNFLDLPNYYIQACIALEYGKNSSSMVWHYMFEEHVMRYICDNAPGKLSKEFVCSKKVQILKSYDELYKASLYKTLAVYYKNDKNIMKTARELFIHRSTLFYRLERIQKLTDIDFEDTLDGIYIMLSYIMLEGIDEFLELFN